MDNRVKREVIFLRDFYFCKEDHRAAKCTLWTQIERSRSARCLHVCARQCVSAGFYQHTIHNPGRNKSSLDGHFGSIKRFIWRTKGVCICWRDSKMYISSFMYSWIFWIMYMIELWGDIQGKVEYQRHAVFTTFHPTILHLSALYLSWNSQSAPLCLPKRQTGN